MRVTLSQYGPKDTFRVGVGMTWVDDGKPGYLGSRFEVKFQGDQ